MTCSQVCMEELAPGACTGVTGAMPAGIRPMTACASVVGIVCTSS